MYRLLVVDDEAIEREALKFVIKNNCKRITGIEEASNGKEAIAKASSFKPDIILMDIKMPGINGIEAAKTIRQYFPGCRIALLTAFDYFEYAREAIKIGVEDFIIKPAANEQVIEVVDKAIDELEKERTSMTRQVETENKLGQVTQFLEYELISAIVNGEFDNSQINEYFSLMNIEIKRGFAIAAEIDFNSSPAPINSHLQKDMIKKRCMEKLKRELEKNGCKSLGAHIGNTIYVLVLYGEEHNRQLKEKGSLTIINEVHEAVCSQLNVGLAIGIGRDTSDPDSFHEAFQEAKAACRSRNRNENCVFCYDGGNKKLEAYPDEIESKLCDSILSCNENEACGYLQDIIGWMTGNLQSKEAMHWRVCELMIVLSRSAAKEYRIETKDARSCFQELQLIESSGELRSYLLREVKSIINEINDRKSDRSGLLIDKVCEFIKQNYSREISLEDAAGMVGLSNFYFSKVFKQYKKTNFTDYIAEVRINKAKELLKDPKINIKDIGELVGYSDPNYFTRVFKRTEGITPSEYRSKIML